MSVYEGLGANATSQAAENKIVNRAMSALPASNITGLKLRADISLGNLTLNTIDTDGVVWVCTDIQGWWSTPETEFPEFNRGWGDGSYDVRGRWTARDLTLTGTFLTQDPSQVAQARQKLIDATSLVYQGDWLIVRETLSLYATEIRPDDNTVLVSATGLTVNQPLLYQTSGAPIPGLIPNKTYYIKTVTTASSISTIGLSETVGGSVVDISSIYPDSHPRQPNTLSGGKHSFSIPRPKTSYVRTSGRPEISTINARGRTDFSIGLRAADPIKYEYVGPSGESTKTISATSGQTITIVNSGNARVPMVINVTAGYALGSSPTTIPTVKNTTNSEEITFDVEALPTGSVLEIDTYNREVLKVTGAVVASGRKYVNTISDWMYLEPGSNSITVSNMGTSTVSFEYRSGWIG